MEAKQMKEQVSKHPASDKQPYSPPQIEVIKMESEGSVMSASNFGGGSAYSTGRRGSYRSSGTRRYNSSSTSDLEDLINDILTIEK